MLRNKMHYVEHINTWAFFHENNTLYYILLWNIEILLGYFIIAHKAEWGAFIMEIN